MKNLIDWLTDDPMRAILSWIVSIALAIWLVRGFFSFFGWGAFPLIALVCAAALYYLWKVDTR